MILEACVGNLRDALSAQKKGAHQIELCDRLDLDGNSPPIELIEVVTRRLMIPVKVIINPKPFNYQYTTRELDEIQEFISTISKYELQGIVFGPLDGDHMPDMDAINRISETTNLPITYHKAIDTTPNILEATKMLLDQNLVKYILTSGGEKTAEAGIDRLRAMQNMINQYDSNIKLIAAGSITDRNLQKLNDNLGLSYYHGKLIVGKL